MEERTVLSAGLSEVRDDAIDVIDRKIKSIGGRDCKLDGVRVGDFGVIPLNLVCSLVPLYDACPCTWLFFPWFMCKIQR